MMVYDRHLLASASGPCSGVHTWYIIIPHGRIIWNHHHLDQIRYIDVLSMDQAPHGGTQQYILRYTEVYDFRGTCTMLWYI